MEIKIKIPTLFPKYRIIKKDGKFLAQSKSANGYWYSIDKVNRGRTWTESYNMEYCAVDSFEEAMSVINRTKEIIVWIGR